MDAIRYYSFLNTLQIEESGPGMYHFRGSLNGFVLSGIFHYRLNAFVHLAPEARDLTNEELIDIKRIIKTEIQEKEKK